jgi:hypothetical protein
MDALGSVIVLGALGTGIAYILNYRLITDDGATVASTVTYLIPVVAVLFGMVALGESLSLRVLSGMLVVRRRRAGPAHPPAGGRGSAADTAGHLLARPLVQPVLDAGARHGDISEQ